MRGNKSAGSPMATFVSGLESNAIYFDSSPLTALMSPMITVSDLFATPQPQTTANFISQLRMLPVTRYFIMSVSGCDHTHFFPLIFSIRYGVSLSPKLSDKHQLENITSFASNLKGFYFLIKYRHRNLLQF